MENPSEFKILRIRECSPVGLCDTATMAVEYWNKNIANADWFCPDREHIVELILNTKLNIIGHHLISIGSLNECICHPREVLRPAIIHSAYAFLLMHNHPSGDTAPSAPDFRITKSLREASNIMQITFLDHIIVGSEYYSFRESGII